MKTRLNITIENTILMQVKAYAASNHLSISQIVEDHLKSIVTPPARSKSILDVVDQLDAPANICNEADLKEEFYKISRDKKLQMSALAQLPVYATSEFLKLL